MRIYWLDFKYITIWYPLLQFCTPNQTCIQSVWLVRCVSVVCLAHGSLVHWKQDAPCAYVYATTWEMFLAWVVAVDAALASRRVSRQPNESRRMVNTYRETGWAGADIQSRVIWLMHDHYSLIWSLANQNQAQKLVRGREYRTMARAVITMQDFLSPAKG